MSIIRSFSGTVDKLRLLLKDADSDLKQRNLLFEAGENTVKIEGNIRKKVELIAIDLDSLVVFYNQEPRGCGLCSPEKESKRLTIKQIEDSLDNLEKACQFGKTRPAVEMTTTKQDIARVSQDSTIDSIAASVENLKVVGGDIGTELDLHLKLLTDLDRNVETKDSKMKRVSQKVEVLIQKSSDECLCMVVLVLMLMLVLFIVYLCPTIVTISRTQDIMFADLRSRPDLHRSSKSSEEVDSYLQIRNLISDVESVIGYGYLISLNSVVYCLTYLPLLSLLKLPQLSPDLLRLSFLCIGSATLYLVTNEGRLYHDLKEQDFIKLSAFSTILQVANTLLRSLGKRLMLNLHMSSHSVLLTNYIVTTIYILMHTAVHYCQLIVLQVALSSSFSTSALFFITNFFFELKSFAFRKMDRRGLFNVVCQDFNERLELSLFLFILVLKATVEGHYNCKEIWLISFYVFIASMVVDWVKHYFLVYQNQLSDSIFAEDFYTDMMKNLSSAIKGYYMDYSVDLKLEICLDPYNSLALSYKCIAIPQACVVTFTQLLVACAPVLLTTLDPGDCGLVVMSLCLVKCGLMKMISTLTRHK